MALQGNSETDIFISYAHANNTPMVNNEKGWVTVFFENFIKFLGMQEGIVLEDIKTWFDKSDLKGGERVSEILDIAKNSALLLIILSPKYLERDFCLDEVKAFLRLNRKPDTNIFIVEFDAVSNIPQELKDIKRISFWSKNHSDSISKTLGFPLPESKDKEYFDKLKELAESVAKCLRSTNRDVLKVYRDPKIGHKITEGGALPELMRRKDDLPKELPSIFLAQATEDLDEEYNRLAKYFRQFGFTVRPETEAHFFSPDFESIIKRDISQSKVFIQLLSAAPGKKTPALPNGYPNFQWATAKSANLPIFQWRSAKIDTTGIQDAKHRELLEGETVSTEGLMDFQNALCKLLSARPKVKERISDSEVVIFVNTVIEKELGPDRELTEKIIGFLDKNDIGRCVPRGYDPHDNPPSPEKYRENLIQNLENCEGVIIVYGSNPDWVQNQIHACRKYRKAPFESFGVVDGPPENKGDIGIRLPRMKIMDARKGLDEGELKAFIKVLLPESRV